MIKVISDELLIKLEENGNKCLCTVEEVDCMCEEFRNMEEGICHCGVFERMSD